MPTPHPYERLARLIDYRDHWVQLAGTLAGQANYTGFLLTRLDKADEVCDWLEAAVEPLPLALKAMRKAAEEIERHREPSGCERPAPSSPAGVEKARRARDRIMPIVKEVGFWVSKLCQIAKDPTLKTGAYAATEGIERHEKRWRALDPGKGAAHTLRRIADAELKVVGALRYADWARAVAASPTPLGVGQLAAYTAGKVGHRVSAARRKELEATMKKLWERSEEAARLAVAEAQRLDAAIRDLPRTL